MSVSDVGTPCAIGGWFERFGDRADLWLWHAPDWFWLRDHGYWPTGMARSGITVPLLSTLYMLWRRWIHREEVTWWGYADDINGRPVLRLEPMNIARVIRKNGLLSHGVQVNPPPRITRLTLALGASLRESGKAE